MHFARKGIPSSFPGPTSDRKAPSQILVSVQACLGISKERSEEFLTWEKQRAFLVPALRAAIMILTKVS